MKKRKKRIIHRIVDDNIRHIHREAKKFRKIVGRDRNLNGITTLSEATLNYLQKAGKDFGKPFNPLATKRKKRKKR